MTLAYADQCQKVTNVEIESTCNVNGKLVISKCFLKLNEQIPHKTFYIRPDHVVGPGR